MKKTTFDIFVYFTSADVTFVESLPYFPATTSLGDSSLAPDVASIPLPVPFLSEPASAPPVLSSPRSPTPLVRVDRAHQLLLLHHPPHRLQIQCFPLNQTPCPLPYGKVHVLALLTILSVSLYPLVLYLLPSLVLFPTSLVFPFQRQCIMLYFTPVGGKLWNWK
jgi:hypothetical protein